jgi:cytoskeletal protein CcmA (bactofilin family)
MSYFGRRDPVDMQSGKPPLKPALYDPPGAPGRSAVSNTYRPPATPPSPSQSAAVAVPASAAADASASPSATTPSSAAEPQGSKLHVGVNIKLKGVDISDCDVLVIEGSVEATVHSKAMQIAKPGTLKGTALIDVAEIQGEFSGELTARTRLVVHSTGRVSGTIRYGKLIVAEGGELTGDVKRMETADEQRAQPSRGSAPGTSLGTGSAGGLSPR